MRDVPLIGREHELDALAAHVRLAPDVGSVLLVLGEPGIGKTSLLRATAIAAQQAGCRVLGSVGVEAEAQLPFAGLHQLLSPLLNEVDSLPAIHRHALLAAFGLAEGERPDPYLIAEAALLLVAVAAADLRVVIIADDVQWLDPQTQEILTFFGHRIATLSVSLIGAARPGHPAPFVSAGFPVLVVDGVDDSAAAAILDARAPNLASAARSQIQLEAAGNPLALIELPMTWRDGGTDTYSPNLSARLEHAFAGRIAELPAATRDALLVAAVDHADDLAEVVAATSVLWPGVLADDVFRPAVDAHLVSVVDGRFSFRHPLVRSAVLQNETVTRRQSANNALAAVLTDQPYRRSWHRAQSIVGPDDEVADELEAAADNALSRGAVLTAVSTLERSAQLTPDSASRGHRLLVAAEHGFELGRADIVDRLVAEAARADLTELDRARMEWLREIFNDGVPGDAARVMQLCEIARRSAVSGDAGLALNLLLGAALRCWWADSGAAARARVTETLDELDAIPTEPRHVAALAVAEPVLRGAEVLPRLDLVEANSVSDADTLRLYGMAAHAVGDSVRATDFLDLAERTLRAQGRLGLLGHVLGMQVNVRLELGDWRGATEAAREVYRLSVETGQPIWTLGNITCDARAQALRGQWERALELVTEAEVIANRQHLNDALCLAQLARGTALIAGRRYGAAYAALRRLFDVLDPSYHQREGFAGLTFLAEAAVHAGQVDDARLIVDRLEQVARITPAPILHVHLGYARAVLADGAEAESRYREALRADLTRWPWARARLALAYGQHLIRTGHPAASREHLRRALAIFEDIGATEWKRQAAAALGSRTNRREAQ